MRIRVNGEEREAEAGMSVEAWLAKEGIARDYMALELNRKVLRKTRYAETTLQDGDQIEIIKLVGGG